MAPMAASQTRGWLPQQYGLLGKRWKYHSITRRSRRTARHHLPLGRVSKSLECLRTLRIRQRGASLQKNVSFLLQKNEIQSLTLPNLLTPWKLYRKTPPPVTTIGVFNGPLRTTTWRVCH